MVMNEYQKSFDIKSDGSRMKVADDPFPVDKGSHLSASGSDGRKVQKSHHTKQHQSLSDFDFFFLLPDLISGYHCRGLALLSYSIIHLWIFSFDFLPALFSAIAWYIYLSRPINQKKSRHEPG